MSEARSIKMVGAGKNEWGKRAIWEPSLRFLPFAVQIHEHRHHLNRVATVAPLQVDCLRHSRHQKWTRQTDGLRNVSGVNPMRNLVFWWCQESKQVLINAKQAVCSSAS